MSYEPKDELAQAICDIVRIQTKLQDTVNLGTPLTFTEAPPSGTMDEEITDLYTRLFEATMKAERIRASRMAAVFNDADADDYNAYDEDDDDDWG